MKLSSQFFQPIAGNIRYRKRIGRGGRIFIDRAGYKKPTSGKTKPGMNTDYQRNAMKRYDFDSDSSQEDSDMEVDEMDDR